MAQTRVRASGQSVVTEAEGQESFKEERSTAKNAKPMKLTDEDKGEGKAGRSPMVMVLGGDGVY